MYWNKERDTNPEKNLEQLGFESQLAQMFSGFVSLSLFHYYIATL